MNYFRALPALAIVLIPAFFGTTAQATVVGYDFTASIDNIWYYNASSGAITYSSYGTFPSSVFATGDSVVGTFSYDAQAPLSPYYQPPAQASGSYQIYVDKSQPHAMQFSDIQTGLHYSSTNELGTLIQVSNNASSMGGRDVLSVSGSSNSSPIYFQTAGVLLQDATSTAFNSSSIPTSLNLQSFVAYAVLDYGMLLRSNGDQLHFYANLTSMSPVTIAAVPEPETYAMMLAGLGMLGFIARRRRSTIGS